MTNQFISPGPSREEIDAEAGAMILEFGTDWCSHCQAAGPAVAQALVGKAVRHIKIEDGPGRPLGRSFRVKLWPTLIFLKDGVEVARTVRPVSSADIEAGLAKLSLC